jgi:putative salt-induced outer membrane protein YdiY
MLSRLLIATTLLAALPARADEPKFEYKDLTKPPAPAAAEAPKPTVWHANLTLGLVWVAGNAQSLGLSGTGLAGVRHYDNEFTLAGGGAYVLSGVSKYGKGGPNTGSTTSAANWFGKARYDRYFLEKNTAFISYQMSGDKPAGYLYRIEPQAGYARLFWKSPRQIFRGEVGYDYTFEHRVVQPMGAPRDVQYHSARVFAYYENKFTPYASFSEGLEMLEAFNHFAGFRLNSLTSLTSQLYKNLALKVNFTLHFNNDPALRPAPTEIDPATNMIYVLPPDQAHFDKVDTQLDVVLAVTFL